MDPKFYLSSKILNLYCFLGQWLFVHLCSIIFGSAPLTGKGSLAVRQSIVKDIIMNPLYSPDKSSIIDFSPLLLGRIWPCHLRPIFQPLDILVHVTVQHWPVNGFSTRRQNGGRPVNNMTTWWPEVFLLLFKTGTITQLHVATSWFWAWWLYLVKKRKCCVCYGWSCMWMKLFQLFTI